jgi:hypothetical protein
MSAVLSTFGAHCDHSGCFHRGGVSQSAQHKNHRIVGDCKTEASRKPVPLDAQVAADLWLWKEASAYSKSEDWVFASPHLLAGRSVAENHSTGSTARRNQEARRLAYISPFVFVALGRERREREGSARTDATCQQPVYARCLFASTEGSEETRSTTGRPDDPPREFR